MNQQPISDSGVTSTKRSHRCSTPPRQAHPTTIALDIRTVEALARAAHWPVILFEIPTEPSGSGDWGPADDACMSKVRDVMEAHKKLMGKAEVCCTQLKVVPTPLNFVEALDSLITCFPHIRRGAV